MASLALNYRRDVRQISAKLHIVYCSPLKRRCYGPHEEGGSAIRDLSTMCYARTVPHTHTASAWYRGREHHGLNSWCS